MNIDTIAVLAGGMATRMRPLTEKIPKALLDVDGEPFIAHQLRLFARKKLHNVVLCIGHLGEQVVDFVGDGSRFGVRVCYSFDGEKLLGTGGALKRALPLLGQAFFVTYGDSYLDTDYEGIAAEFLSNGKPALMAVIHNRNRWDVSNAIFSKGSVIRYSKTEKISEMEYIDYGLGVLSASILEKYDEEKIFDLSSVYSDLSALEKLGGYEVKNRFYEIGSPSGLSDTIEYFRTISEQHNH